MFSHCTSHCSHLESSNVGIMPYCLLQVPTHIDAGKLTIHYHFTTYQFISNCKDNDRHNLEGHQAIFQSKITYLTTH